MLASLQIRTHTQARARESSSGASARKKGGGKNISNYNYPKSTKKTKNYKCKG